MKPIWASITKLGDVFGQYTVIRESQKGRTRVRCTCGNEREVLAADLHSGKRNSCGCGKFHKIGDIVNGRKVVARSTKNDSCLTVACTKCGHESKVRARYQENAACRNCEGFDERLKDVNGTVYALTCPYTGEPQYVGATRTKLNKRMRDHFKARLHPKKKHKPVYVWILELEDWGSRPGMITLEEVRSGDLYEREVFWIKKLTQEGHKLMNIDHNLAEREG